jgi:hypothetical protein
MKSVKMNKQMNTRQKISNLLERSIPVVLKNIILEFLLFDDDMLLMYSPGYEVNATVWNGFHTNIIAGNSMGFFLVKKYVWDSLELSSFDYVFGSDYEYPMYNFSYNDFYNKCIILQVNPSKKEINKFEYNTLDILTLFSILRYYIYLISIPKKSLEIINKKVFELFKKPKIEIYLHNSEYNDFRRYLGYYDVNNEIDKNDIIHNPNTNDEKILLTNYLLYKKKYEEFWSTKIIYKKFQLNQNNGSNGICNFFSHSKLSENDISYEILPL